MSTVSTVQRRESSICPRRSQRRAKSPAPPVSSPGPHRARDTPPPWPCPAKRTRRACADARFSLCEGPCLTAEMVAAGRACHPSKAIGGLLVLALLAMQPIPSLAKLTIKKLGPKSDEELAEIKAAKAAVTAKPPLSPEDVLRQLQTLTMASKLPLGELEQLLAQARDPPHTHHYPLQHICRHGLPGPPQSPLLTAVDARRPMPKLTRGVRWRLRGQK